MTQYKKTTAKERKSEERKGIVYQFQAMFGHTRKAKKQVLHKPKARATGSASSYWRKVNKDKTQRRRHRKLVRAQRQGRRI